MTNPADTFQLHNNVALYGGFAGNETQRSQRNWQTNVTTLNGYWFILGNPHYAFHVVTGSGTNATALLDGFTVTGGKAQGTENDVYGGGMLNVIGSPIVSNVIFSGNSAKSAGGGMYNYMSSPALANVTFTGNSATNSGGAIANGSSNPTIANNILWGNTAPFGAQFSNTGSSPTVTYSDIQGGFSGIGNLNSNPKFIRNPSPGMSDYGDLRLQPGSPATDKGSNAAVPAGIIIDRDGNPRIIGRAVDMGAYEAFLKLFLPLARK